MQNRGVSAYILKVKLYIFARKNNARCLLCFYWDIEIKYEVADY